MTLPEASGAKEGGRVESSLPRAEQEFLEWEREQEEEEQVEHRIVITDQMRQEFMEMMEDMKANRRQDYDQLMEQFQ